MNILRIRFAITKKWTRFSLLVFLGQRERERETERQRDRDRDRDRQTDRQTDREIVVLKGMQTS